MIEVLTKYFPELTNKQQEQFAALYDLYVDWNSKINVISRKDIENLYEHHVLHSLAIAKFINFQDDTNVLDFGTGGGFQAFLWRLCFPMPTSNSLMAQVKKSKWLTKWLTQ